MTVLNLICPRFCQRLNASSTNPREKERIRSPSDKDHNLKSYGAGISPGLAVFVRCVENKKEISKTGVILTEKKRIRNEQSLVGTYAAPLSFKW